MSAPVSGRGRSALIAFALASASVSATLATVPAFAAPAIAESAQPAASATGAADADGLMPAVRLDVPTGEPATPIEQQPIEEFVNRSRCRTSSATPTMTIVIAQIGYRCPVYPGGQSTLDLGFVTLMTDNGGSSVLTTRPGAAGTVWIAAHRTSHGGAFAAVPGLTEGAEITISDGESTATYRVVGRTRVQVRDGLVVDAAGQRSQAATIDSVIRADRGGNMAPRLLLQTCDGENFRWMVYADLVG
jgi:sortase (surface protein transpeptidase)